jgi:hypothetical protein
LLVVGCWLGRPKNHPGLHVLPSYFMTLLYFFNYSQTKTNETLMLMLMLMEHGHWA